MHANLIIVHFKNKTDDECYFAWSSFYMYAFGFKRSLSVLALDV